MSDLDPKEKKLTIYSGLVRAKQGLKSLLTGNTNFIHFKELQQRFQMRSDSGLSAAPIIAFVPSCWGKGKNYWFS